ncbi:MAG: hypothetical protein IV100_06130 [Myxococcales bacterium]|nr:hypothetical protein [Myxococcales bacterium]
MNEPATSRVGNVLRLHGVALVITATWVTLTLTLFTPAFLFHGDHERDLRFTTLLVQHGHWPIATPAISPTPFELGPMAYLLLAPAVWLSPDPIDVRVALVLATAVALLALHALLLRITNQNRLASAIALFGLAASTFLYECVTQLWHSSLLSLTLPLFWLAAESALRTGGRKPLMVASCLAALSLQLHATASVYTVLLGLLAAAQARRFGLRTLLFGLGAWLLTLAPFLWTLVGTLGRLAEPGPARSMGAHGWSPAPLGDVLGFLVDNLHTLWGDDLGPAMTPAFVALLVIGVAVAHRRPFGRLLLASLVLGTVWEWLLLGNQMAHRYMHANLWAAFLLVGIGAEHLLDVFTRWFGARALRASSAIALLLAVAITSEAAVSEVPRTASDGWYVALEQREVARAVATRFPMSAERMERHVHGIYFGEPMGMGHYHAILTPSDSEPSADPPHVLVSPDDLGLTPFGTPTGPRAVVVGFGRSITIQAYTPSFRVLTPPSDGDLLSEKWRRPSRPPDVRRHRIEVEAARPGRLTLLLADGGPRGSGHAPGGCPITARDSVGDLALKPVTQSSYRWIRRIQLEIARPGRIHIDVGPCPKPPFFDLF